MVRTEIQGPHNRGDAPPARGRGKGWRPAAARRILTLVLIVLVQAAFSPGIAFAYDRYDFTYADRASLLTAGWDFHAVTAAGGTRDTERTSGAVVNYDQSAHPGVLRIPADSGDLWGGLNNTRNSLFRVLPANWTSIRLRLSFAPTVNYQQAGLLAYQDDDNYLQVTRIYENGSKVTFAREAAGVAQVVSTIPESATANLYLRIDRNPSTEFLTALYSLDGSTWTTVGGSTQALTNPRLAIVVGASSGGFPNADLSWAEVYADSTSTGTLHLLPASLIFSAVAGGSAPPSRSVGIIQSANQPVSWSTNASWLSVQGTGGTPPAALTIAARTAGLSAGAYNAVVTVNAPPAPSATLPVSLVVNPNVPVKAATWKGGRAGALSISVDDGQASCYDELTRNGFRGTYFTNGTVPPWFYTSYYNSGMELGLHLTDHNCFSGTEDVLRNQEILPNLQGICGNSPEPCKDVISLAWPCGYTTLLEETVAADYVLSARGYNFNLLEEATPTDPMNLKSYNSHEHSPYPPPDLKAVVDLAAQQGKWANLVFHTTCNDNGAIDYAATRSIWVAPIGTIIKYILQRDRLVVSQYQETASRVGFAVARLSLPSSSYRSFETAVGPGDQVTLQVGVDPTKTVANVQVDDVSTPYQVQTVNNARLLLVDMSLGTSAKAVAVNYQGAAVPVISLTPATLSFSTSPGSNPASQTLSIANSGAGTLNWTATAEATAPAWLSVTPASGSGGGTLTVSVNSASLPAGTYTKALTVSATGAGNSPQSVGVTLTVGSADVITHYDFTYPDRTSFLGAGWDFQARASSGAIRDTERTTGAVVSYDQSGHPGTLRIPADTGDLWGSLNNTRNTVLRNLPANWKSIRLRLSFAPTQNYQQAGILAYQDDDNYVQVTRIFENGNKVSFAREVAGSALVAASQPTTASTLYLRLDRNLATNVITGSFSLDGTSWTALTGVAQALNNPRVAVFVGASPGGFPNADLQWVEITAGQ